MKPQAVIVGVALCYALKQAWAETCSWKGDRDVVRLVDEIQLLDKRQREYALECPICVQTQVQIEARINRSQTLRVTPAGERLLRFDSASKLLLDATHQLSATAANDDSDRSLRFQNVPQQQRLPPGYPRTPEVAYPTGKAGKKAATEALLAAGVVRLKHTMRPVRRCMESMRELMETLLERDVSRMFTVYEKEHRHNLLLSPEMPRAAAMLAPAVQVVRAVLEPILGRHAALVEFGAFLTNPGAKQQKLHADLTPQEPTALRAYTVFLCLTHVPSTEDGALQVMPYSHFESPVRDRVFKYSEHLRRTERGKTSGKKDWSELSGSLQPLMVDCGDVLIYDASLQHRGGPNLGNRTRGVIFMTFWGPGDTYETSHYSILPELLHPPDGPLSMRRFEKALMKTMAAIRKEEL